MWCGSFLLKYTVYQKKFTHEVQEVVIPFVWEVGNVFAAARV